MTALQRPVNKPVVFGDETPAGVPLSLSETTENGGSTHVREHKADFVEENGVAYPLRVRADKGNQCLSQLIMRQKVSAQYGVERSYDH